jgi:hypothetical protein
MRRQAKKQFCLRLQSADRARIEAVAKAQGVPPSVWARHILVTTASMMMPREGRQDAEQPAASAAA